MADVSPVVRTLIIEDDFLVAEMVAGMVQELGYDVVGRASNGRDGIELVKSERPDVIVLDLRMAGMDGVETARALQQHCPTPVVVLTAYESPQLLSETSEAGVGAYLVKPPKLQELDRAITIAMARFQELQTTRRLNAELKERNAQLESAMGQIKTLESMLPICAGCKSVRDDEGFWHQVEAYLSAHTDVTFSHGMCPKCLVEYFGEFACVDPADH